MKTFFALLALCEGNPPVTIGFPSQRPVTRDFDVFLCSPEQIPDQTIKTLVIWDAIALIMTNVKSLSIFVGCSVFRIDKLEKLGEITRQFGFMIYPLDMEICNNEDSFHHYLFFLYDVKELKYLNTLMDFILLTFDI